MKADDFFYQCGDVETRVPWFPPDPEFLNAWRDEFFSDTPCIRLYFLDLRCGDGVLAHYGC